MERGPSTADAGCFNPLLFCMRNPVHAREVGTRIRIRALNKRLDAIKARSAAFNFINLESYEDHSRNVHISRRGNPRRETIGYFDRSGVVGEKIERDTRALVNQIMQPHEEVNNNMVVAIVGVGGIGKTTLAQKIFSDDAIKREYNKKIWLSVNQNFSDVELLRRTIIEAGGDTQPQENTKNRLHKTLEDALIGHKTLLVMDDVWDHRAWKDVLEIPFVNAAASDSRVLITTRDEGVARGMKAACPHHHIDTLQLHDGWSLLKKQVLSSEIDEDYITTLEDIGLRIVKKCGGLPLAIKVVGGLLSQRQGQHGEWEQVLDDFKRSRTEVTQELNDAIYLSYEDMPPYLKQCFLFYSLIPHNRMFNAHQVIAMWISEGFVHGNLDDLEQSGRNYYNELVSRNLIEPDDSHLDHYYCVMHDVVRSFAQCMTKNESLVAQEGDIDILTKLKSQKFLRLSIETNRLQSGELDWSSLQEQKLVRSLISTIQLKMKPGDSLVTFSSLRALHIESADVSALVESLHQLKHLRYLALINTDISILPWKIGNMKLLQFLSLHGCTKLVNLPDSIVKLGQLRLLVLPGSISMIPRGFCALTNMRRLVGFLAHMDGDWCSLDELGPLSNLRILGLIQLENVSAASFAANATLGEKKHLAVLSLSCTSRLGDDGLVKEKEGVSEKEQRRIENVFDELCPQPSVKGLYIEGYFGQRLPSWMISTLMVHLKNLKILHFTDLACCTQLPNGLCQLPYLQLLQVDRAPCIRRVGAGFLQAAAIPFMRLKEMNLTGMVEWEEWEWEVKVQAMCQLEKLVLMKCKLEHVPPGLASNARALKVLHLHQVMHLRYLENFPSVVDLGLFGCPNLERISNLSNLQKLIISDCPKLMVLECIPVLEKLALMDYTMEKLPEYMRNIKPRHLFLRCRIWLLSSLAAGQSGLEWDKFSHVEDVKAYAPDRDNEWKWCVSYTRRDNFKLDSNISSAAIQETLSSSLPGL